MAPTAKRKKALKNEEAAPPKKRRTKRQALLQLDNPLYIDKTTFPFLQLPGEIRNMIYKYTGLVDQEFSIRFEAEISERDGRCIVHRLYRARPGPPDRDDLPNQLKGSITKACISFKRIQSFEQPTFPVHIFQVCRQINAEAAPIFYGRNMFVLEAVPHLYAFLMHFHQRLALVRRLGLSSIWARLSPEHYRGPVHLARTSLDSIFPLLANAVNLEALYLHTSILQSFSAKARRAANEFFEQAHCWMHAIALHKKNKLAALDIIKMPALTTKRLWIASKTGQDEFRLELAGRLTTE